MKKLLLLLVVVLFSSCASRLSVQKRHYRPGYYVEYSRSPEHIDQVHSPRVRSAYPAADARDASTEGLIPKDLPLGAEPEFAVGGVLRSAFVKGPDSAEVLPDRGVDDVGIEASQIVPTGVANHTYGRSFSSKRMELLTAEEHELATGFGVAPSAEDGGKATLRIAGIVLASLGLVLLLFVSWPIGLILMLLGLGLLIGGLESRGDQRAPSRETVSPKEPVWQDVVYLKNGSVIKGMIIEQVPNESIKIQTADGSVFVYEMAQVTKIAKEQK